MCAYNLKARLFIIHIYIWATYITWGPSDNSASESGSMCTSTIKSATDLDFCLTFSVYAPRSTLPRQLSSSVSESESRNGYRLRTKPPGAFFTGSSGPSRNDVWVRLGHCSESRLPRRSCKLALLVWLCVMFGRKVSHRCSKSDVSASSWSFNSTCLT